METNHIFLLAGGVGRDQRPHSSNLLSFLLEAVSISRHDTLVFGALILHKLVLSWLGGFCAKC